MKIAGMQMDNNDGETGTDSQEEDESTDVSENDDYKEDESEGEVLDNPESELEHVKYEKNWWDSESDLESD